MNIRHAFPMAIALAFAPPAAAAGARALVRGERSAAADDHRAAVPADEEPIRLRRGGRDARRFERPEPADQPRVARNYPAHLGDLRFSAAAGRFHGAAAGQLPVRRPAPAQARHPLQELRRLPAICAARICRLPDATTCSRPRSFRRSAREHRLSGLQRPARRLARRLLHRGSRRTSRSATACARRTPRIAFRRPISTPRTRRATPCSST